MNNQTRFRASLLHSARLLNDEINSLLLPYQLNSSLWKVLYVIDLKKGCTSIEIAEYLNVSKPSIAKRIQTLTELNVLVQVPTEDKRQKKLLLSDEGLILFNTCKHVINEFEDSLLQTISSEDLSITHKVLNQIIQQLSVPKFGAKS